MASLISFYHEIREIMSCIKVRGEENILEGGTESAPHPPQALFVSLSFMISILQEIGFSNK